MSSRPRLPWYQSPLSPALIPEYVRASMAQALPFWRYFFALALVLLTGLGLYARWAYPDASASACGVCLLSAGVSLAACWLSYRIRSPQKLILLAQVQLCTYIAGVVGGFALMPDGLGHGMSVVIVTAVFASAFAPTPRSALGLNAWLLLCIQWGLWCNPLPWGGLIEVELTALLVSSGGAALGLNNVLNHHRRFLLGQRLRHEMKELQLRDQQLEAVNQQQLLIIENTPLGVMVVVEGVIRQTNQSFLSLFGGHHADFFGRDPARLLAPGLRLAGLGRPLLPELSQGARDRWEQLELLRLDGHRFVAQVTRHCLTMLGTGLATIWWIDDVSEQVAARQRLLDTLRQQEILFEAISVGLLLVRERQIIRCNRCLETLYGYEPGELLGQSTRLFHLNEPQFVEASQRLYRPIGQGESYSGEWEHRRKDGSTFWVHIYGRAMDPKDLSQGSVWVYEDITDRRRASEDLRQALQAADAASRAKGEFLANMSHEIRTPMNAIIGLSHLALRSAVDPKQRDYLGKIQQSGQHLLGIINDILDFSKVEAGKLSVEAIPFDLNKVLQNLFNLIPEKAEAKGLEMVCELDPAVPTGLIGDPLRLGQILINYCHNAIKFTAQGEITVRVRTLHPRLPAPGPGGVPLANRLRQGGEQPDPGAVRLHLGAGSDA